MSVSFTVRDFKLVYYLSILTNLTNSKLSLQNTEKEMDIKKTKESKLLSAHFSEDQQFATKS